MGNTMLLHLVLEQAFSGIMSISDAFSFSLIRFGSIAGLFQILFLLICLLIRITLVKPEIILYLELQRVQLSS